MGKKVVRIIQTLISRVRLFPSLEWQGFLEGIIILLITLMPVLNLWWYLLPPLCLLLILGEPKGLARAGAHINHYNSGTGLWLFWVLLIISAIFASGFETGILKMAQWSIWLIMAGLVYVTFSREFCKKVLNYIVLSSLLWLITGFGQLYRGLPTPVGWLGAEQSRVIGLRIYSVFGNPNIYALYLLSILILAVFLADRGAALNDTSVRTRWSGYFSIFVAGLAMGSLYYTYSRTAWLIAGIIILLWAWRRTGWRSLLFLWLLFTALLLLPGFKARILSLSNFSDSSFGYRMRIWGGVVKALKDFWVWGIGPGNFQVVYPLYQIGDAVAQHAHQFYLQLWLEGGIFSLIAFGRLMKNLFTGLSFAQDQYLLPIVIVVIIFLVYGFFETWWVNRFCGGYFWLLTGLLLSLKDKEPVMT